MKIQNMPFPLRRSNGLLWRVPSPKVQWTPLEDAFPRESFGLAWGGKGKHAFPKGMPLAREE